MNTKAFNAAVKKFQGWIEGDKAYFPSVHLKDEFLKHIEELERAA